MLSFAAPVSYVVGTQTHKRTERQFGPQVITADFNGDGKLDLAVSNTADGTVSVLSGLGNGNFLPAVSVQHRPRTRSGWPRPTSTATASSTSRWKGTTAR